MKKDFLPVLDKNRYFRGCSMARQAPEWRHRVAKLREYLSCSACGTAHPTCLFSAEERANTSRHRRCIGHTGYMRICGHEEGKIRWSDVLPLVHNTTAAAQGPGCNRRLGWRCTDKGHLSVCGIPEYALPREGAPKQCCGEPQNASNYLFPRLGIEGGNAINVIWVVYLPLGRLGESPPTAAALRRRLGEVQDNAGRFMFPAKQPGRELQEPRCFDPNSCDCVYFEGSEDVAWRPYCPLCKRRCYESSHASDPEARLVCLPPLLEGSSSTMRRFRRAASSRPITLCDGDASECRLRKKYHFTRGSKHWNMGAGLCHNTSPCVEIMYHRSLKKAVSNDGKRMRVDWYRALDTDLYSLVENKEGFEVFWCREPHCRNYYESCPDFHS